MAVVDVAVNTRDVVVPFTSSLDLVVVAVAPITTELEVVASRIKEPFVNVQFVSPEPLPDPQEAPVVVISPPLICIQPSDRDGI